VKNIHRWLKGFIYILLISSFQQLATAGSNGDAFKAFIPGSDDNVNNTENRCQSAIVSNISGNCALTPIFPIHLRAST